MIRSGLISGAVEICDEIDNNCDGTIDENLIFGSDADCAGVDCEDIINAEPSCWVDGEYWIDPSGSSPFEAYCDMSTDGGGWTLLDGSMEVMETTGIPSLATGPTPTRLGLWSSPFSRLVPCMVSMDITSRGALDGIMMAKPKPRLCWQRRYKGKASSIKYLRPGIHPLAVISSVDVIQAPPDSVGLSQSYYERASTPAMPTVWVQVEPWMVLKWETAINTFKGHAG